MAVTSSIGPGATNMVTAAALAHVNRLPVLFIPGDVFANRAPDPVLQQIEDFDDGTVSAPTTASARSCATSTASRRPEHILTALPRALRVMTDPANCGPVLPGLLPGHAGRSLRLPGGLLRRPSVWHIRRPEPDQRELEAAVAAIRAAKTPADRGRRRRALFRRRSRRCWTSPRRHNIPMVETQAGKGAVDWEDPLNFGSPGVTGTGCGNELAAEADLVIGVGTRFQDFTTGSWTVFSAPGPQAAVDQHPRLRRRQARRAAAVSRCEGRAGEDQRGPWAATASPTPISPRATTGSQTTDAADRRARRATSCPPTRR